MERKARVGAVTVQVHRGDTLGRIAKTHGVSLGDLMAMNPNLNPRRSAASARRWWCRPDAAPAMATRVANSRQSSSTRRSLAGSPRGTRKIHHTVKSGDTLWHIARSYNINWRDILRWNGRALQPSASRASSWCSTCPAPRPRARWTPSSGDLIYVVRRGDNLWNIGRRYGVTPRQLKRWNNLRSSAIAPGDKLTVKRS